MSTLRRLGAMVHIIATNPGITADDLQAMLKRSGFDISARTFFNDVKLLKDELALLPGDGRMRNGYFLRGAATIGANELDLVIDALNAFSLALADSDAQRLAARLMDVARDFPHYKRVGARRVLGQRVITRPLPPVLEEQFSLALASHRPVRMVYMSPRLSDELRIDVYLLFKVFYERAWYVITRDVGSRSYYPCRLDRIKELKLLDGYPIHQTLGEDIEEAHYLMGCGWGMTFPATRKDADRGKTCPETVVRFSAKVAPYIVEVSGRHPMAKVGYARDGSGDAVFRIRLLDLWEFKHWVRQFGSNAWFLSPPSVVDEEKAEVRRMAARYGWSSDP